MTYWVHKGVNGEHWRDAIEVMPPLPRPVPSRGFPLLHVAEEDFGVPQDGWRKARPGEVPAYEDSER